MNRQECQSVRRVLLLSDGRPGHYRQSEGILAALSRLAPLERRDILLDQKIIFSPRMEAMLLRVLGSEKFIKLVYPALSVPFPEADIIVSAGGKTLSANVALKKITRSYNIFSGSTRYFDPRNFSIHLMPNGNTHSSEHTITAFKPSPFDPSELSFPRSIQDRLDYSGIRITVLIGGPTINASFSDYDYISMVKFISSLKSEGTKIQFVTSYRTPLSVYTFLEDVKRQNPDIVIIDYRKKGAGSIEETFDCDLIFVTSDSMSMISEACVSQRPVIILEPRVTSTCIDDNFVSNFIDQKLASKIRIAELNREKLQFNLKRITPIKYNHIDTLSRTLSLHLNLT